MSDKALAYSQGYNRRGHGPLETRQVSREGTDFVRTTARLNHYESVDASVEMSALGSGTFKLEAANREVICAISWGPDGTILNVRGERGGVVINVGGALLDEWFNRAASLILAKPMPDDPAVAEGGEHKEESGLGRGSRSWSWSWSEYK